MTVKQALQMVTTEVAYISSQENVIGSLAPGKFADLIVLSDDPLSIVPDHIPELEVLMTMVEGKVEFCQAGHETICP